MSAYRVPVDAKPRVWRERFILTGEWSWAASRPGTVYLVGRGFHFDRWIDALNYATTPAEHREASQDGGES